MAKGTIRRLIADRGYGFIRTEQREDLFFHRSATQGLDLGSLREGEQVEFEVRKGRDGRPQAVKTGLFSLKANSTSLAGMLRGGEI